MINKDLLITEVSQKTGYTKKDIKVVLQSIFDSIIENVAHGNAVSISGFGKFDTFERPAREGRNPQTGEIMQFNAIKIPKFRAGSTFKEAIR